MMTMKIDGKDNDDDVHDNVLIYGTVSANMEYFNQIPQYSPKLQFLVMVLIVMGEKCSERRRSLLSSDCFKIDQIELFGIF